MMHNFWGGMWMGWIFWIVILGLIIWGVVTVIKNASRSGGGGSGADESPLDILKKRYARGEISREEFERMKKDLGY